MNEIYRDVCVCAIVITWFDRRSGSLLCVVCSNSNDNELCSEFEVVVESIN